MEIWDLLGISFDVLEIYFKPQPYVLPTIGENDKEV